MTRQNVDFYHPYPEGAAIDPRFVAPDPRTNLRPGHEITGPVGTEQVPHVPFRPERVDRRPSTTPPMRG